VKARRNDLEKNFDSEVFEPGKVRFDNPKKRWQYAFLNE